MMLKTVKTSKLSLQQICRGLYLLGWSVKSSKNIKISCCLICAILIGSVARSQSKVNLLKHQISAVINDQALSKDKKWTVYGDTEMEKKVGSASSGDFITITGWSSLLFQIKTENIKGYISSAAVNSSKEIDSLVLLTKIHFETEPQAQTPLFFKDSAKAELVMTTTKKEVILGECFILSLSFNISDSNRVRMRFHDLGQQLSVISSKLMDPTCWVKKIFIENIEAVKESNSTAYPLMKVACCPTKEGLVSFPGLELSLNRYKEERIKSKVFKSKAFSVTVRKGPPISQSSIFYNYRMYGDFQMEESFSDHMPYWRGNLFYSIEIKGDGLTYPIPPPKVSNEVADFEFIGSSFRDTINNDVYSSRKKFNYRVSTKKEGNIDLNGAVTLKYLNSTTMQFCTLKTQLAKRVTSPS